MWWNDTPTHHDARNDPRERREVLRETRQLRPPSPPPNNFRQELWAVPPSPVRLPPPPLPPRLDRRSIPPPLIARHDIAPPGWQPVAAAQVQQSERKSIEDLREKVISLQLQIAHNQAKASSEHEKKFASFRSEIAGLRAKDRTKDQKIDQLQKRNRELSEQLKASEKKLAGGKRKKKFNTLKLLEEKREALGIALNDIKQSDTQISMLKASLENLTREASCHEEMRKYTKLSFGKAQIHCERARVSCVGQIPELPELPEEKEQIVSVSKNNKLGEETAEEDWEVLQSMYDEGDEHERKPVASHTRAEIVAQQAMFQKWLTTTFSRVTQGTVPHVVIFPPTLTLIQRKAILAMVKDTHLFSVCIPLSSLGRTSAVESEESEQKADESNKKEELVQREVVVLVCSKEAQIYMSTAVLERAVWCKSQHESLGFISPPEALRTLARLEADRVSAVFAPSVRASATKCECLLSTSVVHYCDCLNELCKVCTRRIRAKNDFQRDIKLPLTIPILTPLLCYIPAAHEMDAAEFRLKPLAIVWFPRSSTREPFSLKLDITPSVLSPVQTPFVLHGSRKDPMCPFPLNTLTAFGKGLIAKQAGEGSVGSTTTEESKKKTVTSLADIHFIANRHSLLQLAFGGEEVILQRDGKRIYIGERGLRPSKDPATALFRTVCTDLSVSSDTGEHRLIGLASLGQFNILLSSQLDAIIPSDSPPTTTTSATTLAAAENPVVTDKTTPNGTTNKRKKARRNARRQIEKRQKGEQKDSAQATIDLTGDEEHGREIFDEQIDANVARGDAVALTQERVSLELELETELSRKLVRALLGGAQQLVFGAEITAHEECLGHPAENTVYANRAPSVKELPSVYTRPSKGCVSVGALQQRDLASSLSPADPVFHLAAQQGLARLLGILEAVHRFLNTHTESTAFVLFPREDDAFDIQICPTSCHLVALRDADHASNEPDLKTMSSPSGSHSTSPAQITCSTATTTTQETSTTSALLATKNTSSIVGGQKVPVTSSGKKIVKKKKAAAIQRFNDTRTVPNLLINPLDSINTSIPDTSMVTNSSLDSQYSVDSTSEQAPPPEQTSSQHDQTASLEQIHNSVRTPVEQGSTLQNENLKRTVDSGCR